MPQALQLTELKRLSSVHRSSIVTVPSWNEKNRTFSVYFHHVSISAHRNDQWPIEVISTSWTKKLTCPTVQVVTLLSFLSQSVQSQFIPTASPTYDWWCLITNNSFDPHCIQMFELWQNGQLQWKIHLSDDFQGNAVSISHIDTLYPGNTVMCMWAQHRGILSKAVFTKQHF